MTQKVTLNLILFCITRTSTTFLQHFAHTRTLILPRLKIQTIEEMECTARLTSS